MPLFIPRGSARTSWQPAERGSRARPWWPTGRPSWWTCDHPRTIGIAADRPDHEIQVSFDRETGLVVRLIETIAGAATRDERVTSLVPNAELTPATFQFAFPSGATLID